MPSMCLHALTSGCACAQAKFPDAAVLDSIWELHRIPRRRAMEWFAARREATREERIAASTALEGDDEDAEELQVRALDRDGRGAQAPHTRAPRSRCVDLLLSRVVSHFWSPAKSPCRLCCLVLSCESAGQQECSCFAR